MSSFGAQHPDEGLLVRYIDGELRPRRAREIERHLAACWQCRAETEGLQQVVSDCVQYRKKVLAAHLPEPPNPWRDLYREFDRIDLELGRGCRRRHRAPVRHLLSASPDSVGPGRGPSPEGGSRGRFQA
jgi:Putative zinc-finger